MRRVAIPRSCLTVILPLTLAVASAAAQQATVTGRITDQASGQPIQEARVIVLGTSQFASSGPDGKYTVRNVPVGNADIRVIRVGYTEQKKSVRTTAGEPVTLDFTMTQTIVRLEEVVTTATGEQRRTELGNAVSSLDVSKIVANAPIHQMGDLLVAKAPGVQVLPSNMTGAGSRGSGFRCRAASDGHGPHHRSSVWTTDPGSACDRSRNLSVRVVRTRRQTTTASASVARSQVG